MKKFGAILKRLKSKTYHVAVAMMSIGIEVEMYSPEIKQVVADKIGVSWGIVYAVMFALSMKLMREITKEPISAKGEKSVQYNGSDQNVDSGGNDGDDCDTGVVGLIPKTRSDSDTGEGQSNPQRDDQNERGVTSRSKRRRRAKRRK